MALIIKGEIIRKDWKRVLSRGLAVGMRKAVLIGETIVAQKTSVGATGLLRSGIAGRVLSPLEGIIRDTGPSQRYGIFVEEGRKPGKFPPFHEGSDLELWVRRKLQVDKKKVRSVTFLVARKIARKGTKPQRMFAKSEKQIQARANRIFDNIRRSIEKKLSD